MLTIIVNTYNLWKMDIPRFRYEILHELLTGKILPVTSLRKDLTMIGAGSLAKKHTQIREDSLSNGHKGKTITQRNNFQRNQRDSAYLSTKSSSIANATLSNPLPNRATTKQLTPEASTNAVPSLELLLVPVNEYKK